MVAMYASPFVSWAAASSDLQIPAFALLSEARRELEEFARPALAVLEAHHQEELSWGNVQLQQTISSYMELSKLYEASISKKDQLEKQIESLSTTVKFEKDCAANLSTAFKAAVVSRDEARQGQETALEDLKLSISQLEETKKELGLYKAKVDWAMDHEARMEEQLNTMSQAYNHLDFLYKDACAALKASNASIMSLAEDSKKKLEEKETEIQGLSREVKILSSAEAEALRRLDAVDDKCLRAIADLDEYKSMERRYDIVAIQAFLVENAKKKAEKRAMEEEDDDDDGTFAPPSRPLTPIRPAHASLTEKQVVLALLAAPSVASSSGSPPASPPPTTPSPASRASSRPASPIPPKPSPPPRDLYA
ncbi:hypothetical protein EJ04DRAFT_250882 [Polyplosphaeria fusca]|uniref:Uncharacterized protein n=1 Tax=Polyplosphaeria fusca TaxID=682080 RepID=A0A9P4V2I2_9PLEO|nr:hypothetical protein EJ04DRAFT_250882 [Polyplosphaeria fusca]